VIARVVVQHADELATLWTTRRVLAEAGHVGLSVLSGFDERIAAHLDGCVIAGSGGLKILQTQFNEPEAAGAFALGVVALESQEHTAFEHAVTVAEAMPQCIAGLAAALGWVSSTRLVGVAHGLLTADSVVRRRLGLMTCRTHAVDPGAVLARALSDENGEVVIEALRVAVALGKLETLASAQKVVRSKDNDVAAAGAIAAALFGSRGNTLEALTVTGTTPGGHRQAAYRLALQAMSMTDAHRVLQQVGRDPGQLRWLIQGSGIAGDPKYAPWLIDHMANENTARLASEAFSLIFGLDLSQSGLEGKQPEGFESGPTDDPDDPNVDMDPDEGLPWPDVAKIETWWTANASRFQPGTRYFMGAPVTREHCIDVLKNGHQRQRILAAHYLCLLEPGTPLFNTSAPAWRQQRLLAKLT
jgi:uncharacterized protein (TIGR02270 family)